ncbi:MAG: DUF5711 family protein [Lachnospiraceae bacterium]
MATKQKHKFRTVEVDREDMDKKLRAHRRKVASLVIFVLLLLAIAAIVTYIYYENKIYSSYDVISSTTRSDTSASDFTEFQGKLLKCTNDGAVYTDLAGNLIWNQTYEMDRPLVETCGNYVAIYEVNGTQVYILDTVNLQGSIHTTMPIQKISIAAQGTVAILMENEGTSYLQLYDKTGAQLASGELHVQNSGYPLNLALSENGEKLAVSMLDINDGSVKTVIAFYNFGTVGQNSIDKIVSSYTYADMVIPQIRYLAEDTMVAFGNDRVILFTGAQKPTEETSIELKEEVKSIFYDEAHFGLIYDAVDGKNHRLEYYDISGKQIMDINFDTDYTKVEILANGELCILGENSCEIFNTRGIRKFQYDFQEHLYQILSGRIQTDYVFLLEGETQKVKLR